jgi:hypothetical protein
MGMHIGLLVKACAQIRKERRDLAGCRDAEIGKFHGCGIAGHDG